MDSNNDLTDNSDLECPSDIDLEFEDNIRTPTPKLHSSFVQKMYPLSFFYDYESIKIKKRAVNRVILPMFILDSIIEIIVLNSHYSFILLRMIKDIILVLKNSYLIFLISLFPIIYLNN